MQTKLNMRRENLKRITGADESYKYLINTLNFSESLHPFFAIFKRAE